MWPTSWWRQGRARNRRRADGSTRKVARFVRSRVEKLEDRMLLSAGALDQSFDSDGKATIGFSIRGSASKDEAADVAVQLDGKIVVAGLASQSDDDWVLVRYNPNGSLDASFGSGGTVRTPNTEGGEVASVLIQPDGKIVAVGSSFVGLMNENRTFVSDNCNGFIVARYNTDGTLDTSFGRDLTGDDVLDGIACTGNLGREKATDAVLQPDGKIVVVGSVDDTFALARFNADGSLDASFGPDGTGTVFTGFGDDSEAFGVALQSDGKIVVAGTVAPFSSEGDFALARYNADGSLDMSFSSDGKVVTDFEGREDQAHDVAVQADGKIVVGGTATHITGPDPNLDQEGRFALVRYNSNGTVDTSFGSSGKVTTHFPGFLFNQGSSLHALAIQTNGKIVAAGEAFRSSDPGDPDFALSRYNPNGSLDTTFGTGGLVKTSFSTSPDQAKAIALQIDGQIVVAGTTGDDTANPDFAVARYEGDPTGNPPHCRSDPDIIVRNGTDENFVRNLYEDLLDRPADPSGLDFFVERLEQGAARSDVIAALLGSREYAENLVQEFFVEFLERPADPGGLDFFSDSLQSGSREEFVMAAILGSDEYFALHGSTDTGFIVGLYDDVLGRTPDPGGLAFHQAQLDAGVPRPGVALQFTRSDEFFNLLLEDPQCRFDVMEGWYQDYLERNADQAGREFFFAQLKAGARWEDVQTRLLDSAEYYGPV